MTLLVLLLELLGSVASEELESLFFCSLELEETLLLLALDVSFVLLELDWFFTLVALDEASFESLLWYSGGGPYRHSASAEEESSQLAQKKAVNVSAIFFQCL